MSRNDDSSGKDDQVLKAAYKYHPGRTFLIGLGFMSASIAWAFYNFKIPIVLAGSFDTVLGEWTRVGLLGTAPWIEILTGVIMTIDNIVAVLLQPWFGKLSDRTRSRFGRRTPYFLFGAPLAVLCLIIVPLLELLRLDLALLIALFMIVIFVFNLAMAMYRPAVMSIMPDKTPPQVRSSANSYISLAGGIGVLLGILVPFFAGLVPGTKPVETGEFATQNFFLQDFWGFFIAGIMITVCLVFFMLTVKETPTGKGVFSIGKERIDVDVYTQEVLTPLNEGGVVKEGVDKTRQSTTLGDFLEILKEKDKSALYVLLALFTYSTGMSALDYSFARFALGFVGIDSEATASLMVAIMPVVVMIAAIPIGLSGDKFGRLKTMKTGMIVLMGALIAVIVMTFLPINLLDLLVLFIIILGIGGVGWGMIIIQCLPVVWQLAPRDKIGVYTGIYYLFSAVAAIVSPPLMGTIFATILELGGNQWLALFPYFFICILISFFFLVKVKRGDAEPLSKEELARLRGIFSGDD